MVNSSLLQRNSCGTSAPLPDRASKRQPPVRIHTSRAYNLSLSNTLHAPQQVRLESGQHRLLNRTQVEPPKVNVWNVVLGKPLDFTSSYALTASVEAFR
jgi:hypothetical protein